LISACPPRRSKCAWREEDLDLGHLMTEGLDARADERHRLQFAAVDQDRAGVGQDEERRKAATACRQVASLCGAAKVRT